MSTLSLCLNRSCHVQGEIPSACNNWTSRCFESRLSTTRSTPNFCASCPLSPDDSSRLTPSSRPLWKAIPVNLITGRKQERLPPSIPLSDLRSYCVSLCSTPVSRQLAIPIPEGPPNISSQAQLQAVPARRVKDLLMKMNEKKAAGHDGICSKELKVVANKIAWQLAIPAIQRVSWNWWDPFRFQSWEHYTYF